MFAEAPRVARLKGPFGCALTVDVEEWYHTCLVPDYVNPEDRPALTEELDWLLPELLEMLAEARCSATFFVLGEVAERLPRRIREIAAAGHEVGSHGYLHLRACERSLEAFQRRRRALQGDPGGRHGGAGAGLPGAGVVAAQPRQRAAADRGRGGLPLRQLAHPLPARRPAGQSALRLAPALERRGSRRRACSSSRRSPSAARCACRRGAGRAGWSIPQRLVRAALAPRRGGGAPRGGGPSLGDLRPADAGALARARQVHPRDRPDGVPGALPRAAPGSPLDDSCAPRPDWNRWSPCGPPRAAPSDAD